ncbi:MAG: hypothetical protein ACRBBP_08445 [Bdellovibrionales bacterium]
MGNIYFILKNSIITIIIVCLLQIKLGASTLEDKLMTFVRQTVAPKFLGKETAYITSESLQLTPQDLGKIRSKIYNNPMFDGVKKNAKELFLKEMTEVIKSSNEKKLKEFEKLENLEKK